MSLIETSLYSNILKKEMRLCVYRPSGYDTEPLPVLYFLHGRTGNEQLLRQLAMDKTADEMLQAQAIKPMMIVCPHLDNSRGINSAEVYRKVKGKYGTVHKGRYEDYLVDELIPFYRAQLSMRKDARGQVYRRYFFRRLHGAADCPFAPRFVFKGRWAYAGYRLIICR